MRADRIAGLVALVLVTAGCAQNTPAAPTTSTSSSPDPAVTTAAAGPQDPAALLGVWEITGTGGPTETAKVEAGELRLFRACTIMTMQWKADPNGLFVASLAGYQESENTRGCRADTTAPAWVEQATGFRVDGGKRILLDARGATVAELSPGGKVKGPIDLAPADAEPPVVTDDVRQALRRVVTLPAGLTAAESPQLTGRWVPVDGPAKAYVELAVGGSWTGSDGCNGIGGRWTAGGSGTMLAVSGPQTLIGCDNSPIGSWLDAARMAGFERDVLALVGPDGRVSGKLRRQG